MVWRFFFCFLGGFVFIVLFCLVLLDDFIVFFDDGINNSFEIMWLNIICLYDDLVGIYIVVESFLGDLKEIIGVEWIWICLDGMEDVLWVYLGVVIVGFIDFNLIKCLLFEGYIDFFVIEGKWEFVLMIVFENFLFFVVRVLVIVGSDKRGMIFGVYILLE